MEGMVCWGASPDNCRRPERSERRTQPIPSFFFNQQIKHWISSLHSPFDFIQRHEIKLSEWMKGNEVKAQQHNSFLSINSTNSTNQSTKPNFFGLCWVGGWLVLMKDWVVVAERPSIAAQLHAGPPIRFVVCFILPQSNSRSSWWPGHHSLHSQINKINLNGLRSSFIFRY